jgi:ribosomal protein S27AE
VYCGQGDLISFEKTCPRCSPTQFLSKSMH